MARSKTRICDVCGKELAREANRCPNCGARKKAPKWLKIALVVEFVLLLFLLIIIFM